jgi:hypothetical protein
VQGIKDIGVMTTLLAAALLSLMVPLRLSANLVQLRPFEFLIVLSLLAGVGTGRWRNIRIPAGFLLLIPYLIWHVFSAATINIVNGLREFLQVGAVSIFAWVLAQEAPRLEIAKISRLLCLGMAAILVYTIQWHLTNGYWVSWKKLIDTRLVFVFLPLTLAGLILFSSLAHRKILWLAWAGLAPLLLMSGERKALLIYLFLSALLLARGRMVPLVMSTAVAFASLIIISPMIDDHYLQTQVRTLVEPASTGQYEYVMATGEYMPGDTPSNVQRAFAYAVSGRMIAEHPLMGVGTNQYVDIINQQFNGLPEDMRLGIHSEFQRVLTENGFIGLGLYLLIWGVGWERFRRFLRQAARLGRISYSQARVLPLLLFIPCALFVGTEASGTRAFVTLILISLLPEITKYAFFPSPTKMRRPRQEPIVLAQSVS